MVMTSENMYALDDEDVLALQNEIDSSQREWPVAEADCFVERLDLGPGISTFYAAGSPIPPSLAGLTRHAVAPAPPERPARAASRKAATTV